MLIGDYLLQVVEIVIGGFPNVVEVHSMCLVMSVGRILLQGSISTNLLDPISQQVDFRKVEVGIQLVGDIGLMADIIQQAVHFPPLSGLCPSFSIYFLGYHSLLHVFHSQLIDIDLGLLASLPKEENIMEGVRMMQGLVYVAQS